MKFFLFITPFDINSRNISNSASANRVSLIIKGLKKNLNCNINYSNVSSTSKNIVLKILNFIYRYLIIIISSYKYDYIYIYGEVYIPLLKYLSKLYGFKIILERNEYPNSLIINTNNRFIERLRSNRFKNFVTSVDCFITCSEALKEYYCHYTKNSCNIFILPLVADVNKLESVILSNILYEEYRNNKSITYCGNMGNNKDGVDILILAFSLIFEKYPDYRLKLIGTASEREMIELRKIVSSHKIASRVDFLGFLPHDKVIEELKKSSILTLARPANKQAEGGIPSKLVEYLLTGVPVLVTNVGEISKYVVDSQTGYLSEPNSPESFALKLEYIINNYESACLVGYNGKKYAEIFDYKKQVLPLANYLKNT